jgi:outer membrane protein assembly factor BamB
MAMSPSGRILAVSVETGVQFFHFNAAEPITAFTGIIGVSGHISSMQWDSSNHLYAINGASGRLHVYTAATTGVDEAPGSPYAIGAEGLVVVPE